MTKRERKELARESRDSRVLDWLSRDEDLWVYIKVAKNPNTSVESLDRLSRDEYGIVRIGVARNPNTSVRILDRLSRDKYENVRETVARNPKWKAIQEPGLLDVARRASKWLGII